MRYQTILIDLLVKKLKEVPSLKYFLNEYGAIKPNLAEGVEPTKLFRKVYNTEVNNVDEVLASLPNGQIIASVHPLAHGHFSAIFSSTSTFRYSPDAARDVLRINLYYRVAKKDFTKDNQVTKIVDIETTMKYMYQVADQVHRRLVPSEAFLHFNKFNVFNAGYHYNNVYMTQKIDFVWETDLIPNITPPPVPTEDDDSGQ